MNLAALFAVKWWTARREEAHTAVDGALLAGAAWLHIWQCVHVLMTSPCVKYWGN